MIQSDLFIRGLIVILSLAGLANALYFTFAYYGRIKKAGWVPEVLCAREGSSCVTVVQTPYGSVFGVPNSLLGIIYYLALIFFATIGFSANAGLGLGGRFASVPIIFGWVLLGASAFTVLLGFYLVYALVKKLHTHCPLCYLGHAINATLLILLVFLIW